VGWETGRATFGCLWKNMDVSNRRLFRLGFNEIAQFLSKSEVLVADIEIN
jgi:hypothetical protein